MSDGIDTSRDHTDAKKCHPCLRNETSPISQVGHNRLLRMIQLPCFPDMAFGKRMGSTVRSRRTSGGHASRSQGQRAARIEFLQPA